jgi:ferrous iron transport protein B
MSTAQIVVFTLFVTFYLPCLATLASMVREVGRRLTFAASLALLSLAVIVGSLARLMFYLA